MIAAPKRSCGGLIRVQPQGCQELLDKGIHSIIFIGDSFVHHACYAIMMFLTNDYKRGALKDDFDGDEKCYFGGQYAEKDCRGHLRREKMVCGGTIRIELPQNTGWVPFKSNYLDEFDAIVWGGGNHPVDKNYTTRYGVHDSTVVAKDILKPTCQKNNDNDTMGRKVVWLATHARLCHGGYCKWEIHPAETLEAVERYHNEMPPLLKTICGVTKIASIWDASYQLVTIQNKEAEFMNFERVHWGMELNLLKGYEILRQILM